MIQHRLLGQSMLNYEYPTSVSWKTDVECLIWATIQRCLIDKTDVE